MSPLVVDASAVVAWLIDDSGRGEWVAQQFLASREGLAAPALLPAEVANALRRAERTSIVAPDSAELALDRALALPVRLHQFALLAARVWQLRHAVTTYDAWYVALAEALDAPLLTLDARLARAPGLRCEVLLP